MSKKMSRKRKAAGWGSVGKVACWVLTLLVVLLMYRQVQACATCDPKPGPCLACKQQETINGPSRGIIAGKLVACVTLTDVPSVSGSKPMVTSYSKDDDGNNSGTYVLDSSAGSGGIALPGSITYTESSGQWTLPDGSTISSSESGGSVTSLQTAANGIQTKFVSSSGGAVLNIYSGARHTIQTQATDLTTVENYENGLPTGKTYSRTVTISDYVVRRRVTEQSFNSDDTVRFNTRLYVYYSAAEATTRGKPNLAGNLWFELDGEGVRRYLADGGGSGNWSHGINGSNPGNPCDLDDRTAVANATLANYAATQYTDYDANGQVLAFSSNGTCGSCGNSAGSFTNVYGTVAGGSNRFNDAYSYKQTFRSTAPDATGWCHVEFYNDFKQVVWDVVQLGSGGTYQTWITRTKYYDSDVNGGTVKEIWHPSATSGSNGCTVSARDGSNRPVAMSDGTGTATGLVEAWDYDSNGNLTAVKVRQGTATNVSHTYYLRKLTYSDHTDWNNVKVYFPATETTYPSDYVASGGEPSDKLTTNYDYTFYSDASGITNAIEFKKITYPAVTAGHNGSDTRLTTRYHYKRIVDTTDTSKNLYYMDWTRHEDGSLSYTQMDPATGLTSYTIEDVRTNSSGVITTETGAQAPSDPFDTNEVGQWVSIGGIHLKTAYAYDSYGRTKYVTGPDGLTSYTAYMSLYNTGNIGNTTATVTLSATKVGASDTTYNYQPISIDVSDLAGHTLVSAQGLPTTGTDGNLINDWTMERPDLDVQAAFVGTLTSRTEFTYNLAGGILTQVAWSKASDGTKDKYTTNYAYDTTSGRLATVTTPDGTITKRLYDALGRANEVQVGTSSGNMVTAYKTFLDGATDATLVAGGDGNVTETRQYFGSGGSNYYAAKSQFDWRNRLTQQKGPENVTTKYTFTNSSGKSTVETYYDANNDFVLDLGELRGASDRYTDERGQTYKTVAYDVSSGTAGHTMTSQAWHDARGRTIKTRDANGLYQKTRYDSAGRTVARFTSYDVAEDTSGGYSDASSVAGDTVLEQVHYDYDATTGQLAWITSYQRNPGASTIIDDLSTSWLAADSRRTYQGVWYDSLGRVSYQADYGTNGGSSLSRSGTPPEPNSADTVHATKTEYDSHGRAYKTTNNKGILTQTAFDDLDRITQTVENYTGGGTVVETDTAGNRTTETKYDSAGRQSELWAYNPKGSGNGIEIQKTFYVYGTATGGITPAIYRNDLLRAVIYPDSTDPTDLLSGTNHVEYTYDRLGRKVTMKDQNGTVHTYAYNAAGRPTQDQATTLGTNINGDVRRIERVYDDIGRTTSVASYSATSGGTSVNEVKFTYTDGNWGQLTKIEQANTGPVGSSTPAIDYAYADGNISNVAKYVRLTSVTYPGPSTRRIVYRNYPTSGDGAVLSRIDNLAADDSGTSKYAQYSYLGTGTIFKVQHPLVTNNLVLNYDSGTAGTYTGLDQFGQTVDQNWTVNGTAVDRYQYAYDRGGNRRYRENVPSGTRSELYAYDNLARLTNAQKGALNGTKDALTGTPTREEQFTLDELGNWSRYLTKDTTGATDLDHARAHNAANEMGTITTTTGPQWISPVHDAAGNVTEGPAPGDEIHTHKYLYDAWNRLVQVKDNSNVIVATYRYNGLNHRVRKLLGSNPASPTTTYDYYYNERWQVIEERRDGIANPYAQYVWDERYIDALVVRFRDSDIDGTVDDTLYCCNDANMNVTALVDTSGSVQERYTYDPYGKRNISDRDWVVRGTSSYAWTLGHQGLRHDESGLVYNNARMLNPALGRFMQEEPFGAEYLDTLNLYQAYGTNPINRIDPSGFASASGAAIPTSVVIRWAIIIGSAGRAASDKINEISSDLQTLFQLSVAQANQIAATLVNSGAGRAEIPALVDNTMKALEGGGNSGAGEAGTGAAQQGSSGNCPKPPDLDKLIEALKARAAALEQKIIDLERKIASIENSRGQRPTDGEDGGMVKGQNRPDKSEELLSQLIDELSRLQIRIENLEAKK